MRKLQSHNNSLGRLITTTTKRKLVISISAAEASSRLTTLIRRHLPSSSRRPISASQRRHSKLTSANLGSSVSPTLPNAIHRQRIVIHRLAMARQRHPAPPTHSAGNGTEAHPLSHTTPYHRRQQRVRLPCGQPRQSRM